MSDFFCKMHHLTPFFLDLRLYVQRFEMPLEGETLATVKIVYGTDPVGFHAVYI